MLSDVHFRSNRSAFIAVRIHCLNRVLVLNFGFHLQVAETQGCDRIFFQQNARACILVQAVNPVAGQIR